MRGRLDRVYVAGALLSWSILIYLPFVSLFLPMLGLVLILLCLRQAWPHDWRVRAGIDFDLKSALMAFGLATVLILLFKQYFIYAASKSNATVDFPPLSSAMLFGAIFSLIQTLAEEIILGSLLLRYFQGYFPARKDPILAASVGLVFALLHALFYRFGLFQASSSLSALVVLSLFLVGTLRNLLILTYGHIAFAWAIHFAWNFHMFNSPMQTSGSYWGESERFNRLLGSWEFATAAGLGLGLAIVLRKVKGIQT